MKIDKQMGVDMVNLIDVCSKRGAFQGEELAGVGAMRQKLANAVVEEGKKEEADKAKKEGKKDVSK
ncbi:hypothetical protein OAF54_01010 [bacterium]|nr:hypothetical protein [bacterium]